MAKEVRLPKKHKNAGEFRKAKQTSPVRKVVLNRTKAEFEEIMKMARANNYKDRA